ncbi:MAG: DUF2064 domain-containing protein [Gammaproteobacteria bacterium]|nr:MAG: DUF2064 domain-containing protein [Gammaproteobacteria bacterium]
METTLRNLESLSPTLVWSHRGSVSTGCEPDISDGISWHKRVETLERLYGFDVQSAGNLGGRMRNAINSAVNSGLWGIIVGADCPSVTAEHILQVHECLSAYDVVLIPSDDGGYVAIGSRVTLPAAFDHCRWGSGHALADTLERLQGSGLTVKCLAPLWDVDTLEDWERWKKSP